MSGLVHTLVIVALVALVIVRQFRARAIDTDRRWWLVPVVLAAVAFGQSGIVDPHHRTGSAALLAVEVLIALGTGAGWAWTSRVWTAPDGVVWAAGTRAGVVVWLAGIALRVGVFALGAACGVHQHGSALLLGLAVTLLVRAGILTWRAQSLRPAGSVAPAYGDGVRLAWKERV